MLFPHGSHTMEKLLCQLAGLCLAAIKYAIPTPKKWQKAAGASGKGVGRVFQAASLRKGGLTVEAALALPLWLQRSARQQLLWRQDRVQVGR